MLQLNLKVLIVTSRTTGGLGGEYRRIVGNLKDRGSLFLLSEPGFDQIAFDIALIFFWVSRC